MGYRDFENMGGQTDVPLKSPMLRRWAILNEGCPECGNQLTKQKHCNFCGNDFVRELVAADSA